MADPKKPLPTEIGRLLKSARLEMGLSSYELAIRSGINRSTLKRIEDGSTTQPDIATLNGLARVLELDPEEFYDAYWQDTAEPLPSPGAYFRKQYQLTDEQLAELESAVERITKPGTTPKPPRNTKPTERRSS